MREAPAVRRAPSRRRESEALCPYFVRIVHTLRSVRTLREQEITALRRCCPWYHRCSTSCAMRFFWPMLVLAGCQPGGVGSPDATDGSPDVPPRGQGLFVTWRADPGLPGVVSDKITVLDAMFQMES